MDAQQKQLSDKIIAANNILVTVSNNPTVDQLSACLGLTLLLNRLNKHATAVFSGEIPSTIEFLQPEGTIEKNTDSLRDFIIALDKNKADKLRYKVEDQLVRIFITPYRSSITQNDLEFSQGDFNVDLVIALGVTDQADLDTAITAHGRILHDATVSSINVAADGGLGSITWHQPLASSLCEIIVTLVSSLGKNLIDRQIATALLTGIVAETKRFSNEKTSPQTMSISAELLSYGADQQLVSSKLIAAEEAEKENQQSQLQQDLDKKNTPKDKTNKDTPIQSDTEKENQNDGQLEVEHNKTPEQEEDKPLETPDETQNKNVHDNEQEKSSDQSIANEENKDILSPGPKIITEPPTLGGTLTANSQPEPFEPTMDQLTDQALNGSKTLLSREDSKTVNAVEDNNFSNEQLPTLNNKVVSSKAATIMPPSSAEKTTNNQDEDNLTKTVLDPLFNNQSEQKEEPEELDLSQIAPKATLDELEKDVNSPHQQLASLNDARNEVSKAISESFEPPKPIAALNAVPLGDEIVHDNNEQDINLNAPVFFETQDLQMQNKNDTETSLPSEPKPTLNENTAPPVPPPLPYQFHPPEE